MHILTQKRVEKFGRDFGFDEELSTLFELYVAATYLYRYIKSDPEQIRDAVLGGGQDEGVDVAAVIVNGQVVREPEDIDNLVAGQDSNSARVIFMQAKTSEKFDTKLMSKFLHGVEAVTKYAMGRGDERLPAQLVDLANLIEKVAENGDKFTETRIPCDLYYVTTSSNPGNEAKEELQVRDAIQRIRDLGVYVEPLQIKTQGHEDLAAKQKERLGPQNIQFSFEKRQTIPDAMGVDESYIGLISGKELLKLLADEREIRPGIFEDNVRLHLGIDNPVNRRIADTLASDSRSQFPFLNNGLTIIATKLQGTGDRFFISGYQVVNGGQTSNQFIRWALGLTSAESKEYLETLWIPVKIISSEDRTVRSRVAVATNMQTPIGNSDIQGSLSIAKDVEEFFAQSGSDGLRYERQGRGVPLDFARTRVVGTSELNRAVASTIFGESSRAIGSPKDLEFEDSGIWGDYPVEMYFYAAWILYRIDRYFARTNEHVVLKAAKYHFAMMVSALVAPEIVQTFGKSDDQDRARTVLRKLSVFKGIDSPGPAQERIERAIPVVASALMDQFKDILSSGRSLRKDDVRSRRMQEQLLALVRDGEVVLGNRKVG